MNSLPDRIAIVGTSLPGGGSVLSRHLRRFLEGKGVQVDFYDGAMLTLRIHQKQRRLPEEERMPVLKLPFIQRFGNSGNRVVILDFMNYVIVQ